MASDAIVRLLFNTADFDKNIKRAKGEIGGFEADIKGMAAKAGSSIVKFAGTFGVAVTAGEAFNKVLHSSQKLGDLTASTMNTAKESVDQFFYSLGAGEFNGFLSGLDQIISKAKEAYAAMDQLGNTKISHGFFSSENEMQIQEAQYVAKNKFAPLEERMLAFDQWREALNKQEEINKTLQKDLVNAIVKSVDAEIGSSNVKVNFDDVKMALRLDVTSPEKRDELKGTYGRQYENYRAVRENLLRQRKGTLDENRIKAINTQLEDLDNTYREAIIVNAMLNKSTDEELQNIATMGAEYMKLNSSLASVSREYNETANEFNNANKAVKGFVRVLSLEGYKTYTGEKTNGGEKKKPDKIEFKEGSIGYLEEQISKKRLKFRMAVDDESRAKVQEEIDSLVKQKHYIELGLELKYSKGVSDQHSEIKKIQKDFKEMSRTPDFKAKKGEWKPPITREDIKSNEDFEKSLNAIGNAFGSMSSMADGATGSILSYFGNLMNSIATAIPAITALTTTKKAEATANTEAAATGAASSVASIPFVGPALAVAAIASVLAALATIPKFADGGIVGGSSFFGDNMIARVNSGEMILNQSQQGKLFDMINSGGSSNRITVDGEARVSGKAMYITIRNYMKANNIKW